jgi:hypothetical protein
VAWLAPASTSSASASWSTAVFPTPRGSVCGVTRFVVDCRTLLPIAAGEIEVAAEHKLIAPTLVRSQALSTLYEATPPG